VILVVPVEKRASARVIHGRSKPFFIADDGRRRERPRADCWRTEYAASRVVTPRSVLSFSRPGVHHHQFEFRPAACAGRRPEKEGAEQMTKTDEQKGGRG